MGDDYEEVRERFYSAGGYFRDGVPHLPKGGNVSRRINYDALGENGYADYLEGKTRHFIADVPERLVGQQVVVNLPRQLLPRTEPTTYDEYIETGDTALDMLLSAKAELNRPGCLYVELQNGKRVDKGNIDELIMQVSTGQIGDEAFVSNDPEFLRREAERMLRRAEILESVPKDDPFAVGQVLTFSRFLSGTEYKYAALKCEITSTSNNMVSQEKWFVTGGNGQRTGYFWNELIDFIRIDGLKTIKVLDMDKAVSLQDYVRGVQKVLEAEMPPAVVDAE